MDNIYNVLKGSFLTDDSSVKNWRLIIFVMSLLLIMIWSAHSADEKVVEIAELNKKKREIRAAYIDANTALTQVKMESNIRKKVYRLGLSSAKKPPKKIKVIVKNNK